jgi:superoxide dismutase, Fe-Mn family
MMKRVALFTLLVAFAGLHPVVCAQETKAATQSQSPQPYKAQDFSHLLGMPGFSDHALNLHFKLYQGYVTNTNMLMSILQNYANEGKDRSPQYAEIKRRLGWEFDGMRLHEYYFGNLGGHGTALEQDSDLAKRINQDFGSYEAWKKDFVATGSMRGIGWVVLYFDPIYKKLINTWVGEHDIGNLAGARPILVMDVWEHAYMPDYGLDRADYIKAFFDNINWQIVQNRYPYQQQ